MAVTLVTTIKRYEGTAAEMAAMVVTSVPAGSTFFQNDTGLIFNLSAGGTWTEKKTNGTVQLYGSIPEYGWLNTDDAPTPDDPTKFALGMEINTTTHKMTAKYWNGTAWQEVL